MRSRALQPRSLFRILAASPTPSRATVAAAATASASALAAAALSSTTPAASSSSSSALAGNARRSSTNASFPASCPPGSSSRQRHRSRSGSLRRARQAVSAQSTQNPSPSSPSFSSAFHPSSNPVIPVRPPPHSKLSLGLQSFFSQGRPLLEHNNLLDLASTFSSMTDNALSTDALAGYDSTTNGAATVMVVPSDREHSLKSKTETSSPPSSPAAPAASIAPKNLTDQFPPSSSSARGIDAEIKRRTTALMKTVFEMRRQFREATPGQREEMVQGVADFDLTPSASISDAMNQLKGLLSGLHLEGNSKLRQSMASHATNHAGQPFSFSLHLLPLRSISQQTFDSLVQPGNSIMKSPLAIHASIAAEQAWESERGRAVEAARERGEDTLLAQRLGPESDLVVLGEPEGPNADWGRGVASYLAKYGRPYEAPFAPVAYGEEAAKLKTLDDLMTFHVSHGFAAGAQVALDSGANSSSSTSIDGDDVHLWLGHALIQVKTKADLAWNKTLKKLFGSSEGIGPQFDVDSLHAFGRGNEPRPGVQTVTIISAADLIAGHADDVGLFIIDRHDSLSSPTAAVQMDSVRRKRRKKMNKMKYKKLRKKQRAERQKLKK